MPQSTLPPCRHQHCAPGPAGRAAHAPSAPSTCPCGRLRQLRLQQLAQLDMGVEPSQAQWSSCRQCRLAPVCLYLSPLLVAASATSGAYLLPRVTSSSGICKSYISQIQRGSGIAVIDCTAPVPGRQSHCAADANTHLDRLHYPLIWLLN